MSNVLLPLDKLNPPGRDKELEEISGLIKKGQDIILIGPRRVGKTTIINAIKRRFEKEYSVINYDCMESRNIPELYTKLYVKSKPLEIFVSSIGKKKQNELGKERELAEKVIKELHHEPFLIENIMRPDSPDNVEEKNIKNSDAFLLILGKKESNAVEKEYNFALTHNIPLFCMIKGSDDKEREEGVKRIIKDIKEKEKIVYKRYSDTKEFEENLKEGIKEKDKEWRKEKIKRIRDEIRDEKWTWQDIGDKFWDIIKEQKDKNYLFLIDEFGELREDKMVKNKKIDFGNFMAHFSAKIKEKPNRVSFILTGSENIFTFLPYQKDFTNFKNVSVSLFDTNTAKKMLKNKMPNLTDEIATNVIEKFGTLPYDLQLFLSESKDAYDYSEEKVNSILKKLVKDEGLKTRDVFFKYLDDESKKLADEILPELIKVGLKREELKVYSKSKNFDTFLDNLTNRFFILEMNDFYYHPVSKFLAWAVVYYDKDIERFNSLLKT